MYSAAVIRHQIEAALHARIPGALTLRQQADRDCVSTGIPEIDSLLDGGLPVGAITELIGPLCSGRSTLALAVLAGLTAQRKAVAWIDAADTFDPETAAAAGVDLTHQLWVRCGHHVPVFRRCLDSAPNAAGASLLVEGGRTPVPASGGGSSHPRAEVRGLSQAIGAVLKPGTPGAPNRKLIAAVPKGMKVFSYRAADREEQTAPERLPPRRSGSFHAAQIAHTSAVAEAQAKQCSSSTLAGSFPGLDSSAIRNEYPHTTSTLETHNNDLQQSPGYDPRTRKPSLAPQPPHPSPFLVDDISGKAKASMWKPLDHALRATDLLMTTGGFSAIVLDFGSIAPEFAWRVPLATWFRFRAAAERTRTVFILLTQHPCARSSAELVLRLRPVMPQATDTVLTGAGFHVDVDRRRFEPSTSLPPNAPHIHLISNRKPVQRERSAFWQRQPVWTHGGA